MSRVKKMERISALLTQATELADEIRSDMQSYWDDRSEKWQESEKGEEYLARLDVAETMHGDLEGYAYEIDSQIEEINQ